MMDITLVSRMPKKNIIVRYFSTNMKNVDVDKLLSNKQIIYGW
ncbi:MAG TPA: hypothetical protein VM577_11480 [Anaerovoracaceae bacterium]|nr:hypothetical protein [Anaerovoracaceae bacterium]